MKRARVDEHVGADLAVALARNEVAGAPAHVGIVVFFRHRKGWVVGDPFSSLGDFVIRWIPRDLEALLGQLDRRPSLALRRSVLSR